VNLLLNCGIRIQQKYKPKDTRARDGSGYAAKGRPSIFPRAEADSGKPHAPRGRRRRRNAGATRAAFERTARRLPGRCSKHKILTPSFVLFADNGIDHPCHSYGYAFGWPALFSTKITATFPTFYTCCNAVNAPPDKPKVKDGGMRERVQPGARKIET